MIYLLELPYEALRLCTTVLAQAFITLFLEIFERFCRLARPIHGAFSASGLGLALGQSIAERHNTTIELNSTMGEGSRFSFLMSESLSGQNEDELESNMLIEDSYR